MKAMTVKKLIETLEKMPPEAIVGFHDGDEYFAVTQDMVKLKYNPENECIDDETLIDSPRKGYIPIVIL